MLPLLHCNDFFSRAWASDFGNSGAAVVGIHSIAESKVGSQFAKNIDDEVDNDKVGDEKV